EAPPTLSGNAEHTCLAEEDTAGKLESKSTEQQHRTPALDPGNKGNCQNNNNITLQPSATRGTVRTTTSHSSPRPRQQEELSISVVAMALARNFLSEEQFLCSICLDVFSNPVSTPCGHSFCKACIGGYWDGQSKAWQCPLCKESFRKRPELHINRTLREITEQFKRMSGGGASG
ncbi:hypothetical protein COCON_G00100520, partial [Conger conger]